MESNTFIRLHGDYRYEVKVEEIDHLMNADRFAATPIIIERVRPSGVIESIDPAEIGEIHGATSEEALRHLDTAIVEWAHKRD